MFLDFRVVLPCCCSLISSVSTCSCLCFIFVLTFVVPACPTFFSTLRTTTVSLFPCSSLHITCRPSTAFHHDAQALPISVWQLVCQPSFVQMVCACMHTVVSKCEKQKNHVHLSISVVLPCSWRRGLAVGSRRLEGSAVHCAPIPLTVLLWLEEPGLHNKRSVCGSMRHLGFKQFAV